MEQVIIDEPALAEIIFPGISRDVLDALRIGRASVIAEYRFRGRGERLRRADLAIIHERDVVALAEIKYEDHKAPGNHAQIEDYLWFVDRNSAASFTYLTQYSPTAEDWRLLEEGRQNNSLIAHRYIRQLYGEAPKSESPSLRVFRDFLREEYVVYRDGFEAGAEASLLFLLVRGLNLRHAHGLGKLRTVENARYSIELFDGLLRNVISLSDWFYETFRKQFGNRFTPEFGFEAEVDAPSAWNELQNVKGKKSLSPDVRSGGWFWVDASGTLTNATKGWLQLWIGYWFKLDLAKKKISAFLAAEIYSQKNQSEGSRPFRLTKNLSLSEPTAQTLILEAVIEAAEEMLEHPLTPGVRQRIKKLQYAVTAEMRKRNR